MLLKRFGVICAALALAAASLLGIATVASAAITTVFDLNGAYSVGVPGRPVISNNNDQLTIDMSQFRRPTARGLVLSSNTIVVSFPDAATFTATLFAPNLIQWSNNTGWRKAIVVPDLEGQREGEARNTLTGAGLVLGSVRHRLDDLNCNHIDKVMSQIPAAGTPAEPGTAVNITIGDRPPICG